ncbi:MAG: hypothetical protein MJ231_01135 [bacterium]|nr:hypothetical protein [bacterium]
MDIESLESMNNTLTNHLNSMKNSLNNFNKTQNNGATNQQKSGIVIARKGDSGYIKQMDLDEDGEISLEEFNQYCEENGVSEEEKLRMLNMMQTAKVNSKITAKAAEIGKSESSEEEKSAQIDDKNIYARKGDDNYNEAMDTNKNDVVTYQEYMEYCNKHSEKNETNKTSETKETQTYSQNEHYDEEPEITVETEA